MKKTLLILFLFSLFMSSKAQVSKTVNVQTAGTLSNLITSTEASSITNLTVSGTIDARDFKFLDYNMSNLSVLDLSNTQIAAYSGWDGPINNYQEYLANELPESSFCRSNGEGKTTLTSVILPKTITSIGLNAFSNCTGLTSVTFPTSLTSIGGYSFYNCQAIDSVYIPENVSTIGNSPFRSCTANITVSSANQHFIMEDSVLFSLDKSTLVECQYDKKGSYTVPPTVTTISNNAFTDCIYLTKVSIPPSVINIGSFAFGFCTSLKTVSIPGSTQSLAFYAFDGCSGLTSIYSYITSPDSLVFVIKPFEGVDTANCKLYVPAGTIEKYRATNYWKDFSNIIEMTTGTHNLNNEPNIKVYPNPVLNTLNFKGISGTYTLQIIDINGKEIMSKQLTNKESIFVGSMAKGNYILRLITSSGKYEEKIIKK